ncbi:MAG TPA: hypothetical protein VJA47_05490 [archaeon]|nr:hypothetical protein [archaeon]
MEQLKKWIEVEGKMMDAVEFTRFIRRQMASETRTMMEEVVIKEHENTKRLRQLQQLA